jgi:hypothetical protein
MVSIRPYASLREDLIQGDYGMTVGAMALPLLVAAEAAVR